MNMESNSVLENAIVERISTSKEERITFAEYMDMVLYHPEYGYYSTKAVDIGKEGDFFTSVHLSPDFGEMLALQFVQMWEILGQPQSFSLVEMGAGQGYLAADILNFLQQHHADFFAVLEYTIVEKSPGLTAIQQQRLQSFNLRWCDIEDITNNSIVGCFFSNELVDALPVHQFALEQGKLREIYVGLHSTSDKFMREGEIKTGFTEITGELSTQRIKEYFELIDIDISSYTDDYRSEVNLAALDWLAMVAQKLQRGYILTIDYGYTAARYYNSRRNKGTLQCYYQHRRHDDPYILIGLQDITTHVDFTALERWGHKCGLENVGFTQQGLFLMALGLGERIAALSYSQLTLPQLLSRRDSLHQLIDPTGLGNFGVLIQSKGITSSYTLKGLTTPQ